MGGYRAIYLDDETNEKLNKIKNDNPKFNFSAFIRNAVIESENTKDRSNIDKMSLQLIEKEKLKEQLETEINTMRSEFNEIKQKKEEEDKVNSFYTQQKEDYELRTQKANLKLWRTYILDIIDVDEKTAETIAIEYSKLPKPRPFLIPYLKTLKYKFKD